ncbi:hypothetical protein [Enterococcus sp. DIV0756]|uniref:hypothetical protein n=1 Tax=Enterococcus sp. DIV0756 TaxID=2774636 RepID=UPI003F2075FB
MNVFNHEITGLQIIVGILILLMLYKMLICTLGLIEEQTSKISRTFTNRLFIIVCLFVIAIQRHFEFKFISYQVENFDLIGIYGFIIGLLSMYGIYIGFLQFIVADSEKAKYLGTNKIKYLADSSIWYKLTQTRTFLFGLFAFIISPILIVNTQGKVQEYSIYVWQTSIIMLLLIYIFLIGMSLEIIQIMFLMKDNKDKLLEGQIRSQISNKYYNLFQKAYAKEFSQDYNYKFFRNLKYDLLEIDTKLIDIFLNEVFSKIECELESSEGAFKSVKNGEREKYLYNSYKRFVHEKWKFLTSNKYKIGWRQFKKLLESDITVFKRLVNETPKLVEKNDRVRFVLNDQIDNVHNYLFDQLIVRSMIEPNEIDELYKSIKESTRKLKYLSKNKLQKYYESVENHKWERLIENYLNSDIEFDLPVFFDRDDKDFYSNAVFKVLIEDYGDLRKSIDSDEKLKKIIESMNAVHFVAYSLYQLFYPNDHDWKENAVYFKNKLESKFDRYDENENEQLYRAAAKKIATTHINHRITFDILMTIFKDRKKQITNVDYFDQFQYSRISSVMVLFVQGILEHDNDYSDRIRFDRSNENESRIIKKLCLDYLQIVDRVPEIIEFKELSFTMKKLLEGVIFKNYYSICNFGIVSLLYYESILRNNNSVFAKDVFLEAIGYDSDHAANQYLYNESIFTFFAIKLIDREYDQYFNDDHFLDTFREAGVHILDNLGVTIDEYVYNIYSELKNAPYAKMGKIRLKQVANKLELIFFK